VLRYHVMIGTTSDEASFCGYLIKGLAVTGNLTAVCHDTGNTEACNQKVNCQE